MFRRSVDERPVSVNVNGFGVDDAVVRPPGPRRRSRPAWRRPRRRRGSVDTSWSSSAFHASACVGSSEHRAGRRGVDTHDVDALHAVGQVGAGGRGSCDDLGPDAGDQLDVGRCRELGQAWPAGCPASSPRRSRRARRAASGSGTTPTGAASTALRRSPAPSSLRVTRSSAMIAIGPVGGATSRAPSGSSGSSQRLRRVHDHAGQRRAVVEGGAERQRRVVVAGDAAVEPVVVVLRRRRAGRTRAARAGASRPGR